MSPKQEWRHNELERQRNCGLRGPTLSCELCDATPIRIASPPEAFPACDAGRFRQLALNGLAGNKQVPAATRRGKNDTLWYIYGQATGEARPVEGICRHG